MSVGWIGSAAIQRAHEAKRERERVREELLADLRASELKLKVIMAIRTIRLLEPEANDAASNAEPYDSVDWRNVWVTGPRPQFDTNIEFTPELPDDWKIDEHDVPFVPSPTNRDTGLYVFPGLDAPPLTPMDAINNRMERR